MSNNSVSIIVYGDARKEAQEISSRLKNNGLQVDVIDDRASVADRSGAFRLSRTVLFIIAPDLNASARSRLASDLVSYRQESNGNVSLIPVLAKGARAPVSFAGYASVQLVEGEERGFALIVSQCRQRSLALPTFRRESAGISILQVNENSEIVLGPIAIDDLGQRVAFSTLTGEVREVNTTTRANSKAFDLPDGIGRLAAIRYCGANDQDLILTTDLGVGLRFRLNRLHAARVGFCADGITATAVSPSGEVFATSNGTRTLILDIDTNQVKFELMHGGEICALNFSRDGQFLMGGTTEGQLIVWKVGRIKPAFFVQGYKNPITGIDLLEGGTPKVVACSADSSINVWDLASRTHLAVLEGHTAPCVSVKACSKPGFIVSTARDQTIRFWSVDTGECVSVEFLDEVVHLAITPDGRTFCWAADGRDRSVRVFHFDLLAARTVSGDSVEHYANAKVLVVGESGAGKTGLTIRLTEDSFRPTISTDAAWASHLRLPTDDFPYLRNREIWLWDFAGQADYRVIHQIFMDETALALLVFNGQQEDPIVGLSQWNADISKVARDNARKLLVLAKADRGRLTVPEKDIQEYIQQNHFSGYFETSAQTGAGCDQLRHAIVQTIDWSSIPTIASPTIFRLLKDQIVSIRDSGVTLIRRDELRQQLEFRFAQLRFDSKSGTSEPSNEPSAAMQFDDKGLDAVISLLAGPGVVKRLEFGDFIVLRPERINQYASAVIRSVRMQPDEMGWIETDRVLKGAIDFPQDSARLAASDEQILLTAMVQMLVGRGICFLQSGPAGQLLVFPYLFRRERPISEVAGLPLVIYYLNGPLHEIYATLVVKLSLYFKTCRLWRHSADFETVDGFKIWVRLGSTLGGSGTIDLAFEHQISIDTQVTFIRYVHDHVHGFDAEVVMKRNYSCPKCHKVCSERRAIDESIDAKRSHIFCNYDGAKIPLQDAVAQNFSSPQIVDDARQIETKIKALLDNESKELILLGHVMSTVAAAGQIFRPTTMFDWGIDGEIEFKDDAGMATTKKLYLQLKFGKSYLRFRKDGVETFRVKEARHVKYWRDQAYPVWLVIETPDGGVRWMNVTEPLKEHYEDFLERERRVRIMDQEEQVSKVQAGTRRQVTDRAVLEYIPPSTLDFKGVPFDVRSVIDIRRATIG